MDAEFLLHASYSSSVVFCIKNIPIGGGGGRDGGRDPYCVILLCSYCSCIAFRLVGERSAGINELLLYEQCIHIALYQCIPIGGGQGRKEFLLHTYCVNCIPSVFRLEKEEGMG